MNNLLTQSPTYWRALRAILTGTTLTALQYNKLVYLVSEYLLEQPDLTPREMNYTLLDSPMEVIQAPLCLSLKEVIEKTLFDGKLTGLQRAQSKVTLQKMKELNLASEIEV